MEDTPRAATCFQATVHRTHWLCCGRVLCFGAATTPIAIRWSRVALERPGRGGVALRDELTLRSRIPIRYRQLRSRHHEEGAQRPCAWLCDGATFPPSSCLEQDCTCTAGGNPSTSGYQSVLPGAQSSEESRNSDGLQFPPSAVQWHHNTIRTLVRLPARLHQAHPRDAGP
ncbi:hypothetical protein FA95DRAFT_666282 [Auriscalpium vulgare]|uniref:Uncharacterized protein n=1 Tax=Auriscalpium vulgare TaxID=40419 RepID=A0ACB8S1U5_9AGAM|nr:hypothetical protein FA95DRAFT_666282 [Auriscalpium vulgare]